MPDELVQKRLRLWSALNLLTVVLVLGIAALQALMIVLFGAGHPLTPLDQAWPQMAAGALGGLLVAVLAGWFDRRYVPWTAGLVLVGAVAAPAQEVMYDVPVAVILLVPGVSAVLRARAGRGLDPTYSSRRQVRTAVAVTAGAVVLAGMVSAFVVVQSEGTPLYEAMRSDPMAADELPGLSVEYDSSKDETTPLGIPSAAQIDRTWTITDGQTRSQKRAELSTMAHGAGWARGLDTMLCGFTKTIDGFRLCLVIRAGVDDDEVIVSIREDGS